jgi:hypothetical protein
MAVPRKGKQDLLDEIVRLLEDYERGTPTRRDTQSPKNIDDSGE